MQDEDIFVVLELLKDIFIHRLCSVELRQIAIVNMINRLGTGGICPFIQQVNLLS